jgi:ribose transport system substrate-binding protein
MFRFYHALLVLASILPLVNCGGSHHDGGEKYYLVATNVKVPYWQQAASGLVRSAGQLKVQAEMVGPETYDPKAQRDEFVRLVARKPSGILISVADPNVMQPEIDKAIAQGIPVITIDSDAAKSKRLMFVGTDNYKAGMMGAEVAAKQLGGKGNVVVYTIPEQTNLNQRLSGYEEVFARHPNIKIVQTVDMKGDPAIAFDRTRELLEKNVKVDAFVCLEAIACPEVAEVLERGRITGKVVVAMDTDQRTLEAIQKGSITATVAQKPYTMAFVGLKLLDDLHHNPPQSLTADFAQDSLSPLPSVVDTGITLVDKGNVEHFIQARSAATSPK